MASFVRKCVLFGCVAGCSMLATPAAHAFNGPSAIEIDGGPLGQLELSGGADGYFFTQSETGGASGVGSRSTGANLGSALIELAKTSGILRYTVEVGATGGTFALGTTPSRASLQSYRASPLYAGYVTIAPPGMPFTLSVGQTGSLEGDEAGVDWWNDNLMTTALWYVQNSQNVGVTGTYTSGPFTLTLTFGDGWDTGVFNFLQGLATYKFNDNNVLSLYYAGNLGRTGLNAQTYGGAKVGAYGSNYVNSQMFGAYYSYTVGNLNVIPEIQYVYAKEDHAAGVNAFTSDFGAAVFGSYAFGTSPYSLAYMAEYTSSNGPSYWFVAPHVQAVGFELTPTWQYKNLFTRASVGYLHLLHGAAYGSNASGKNVVQAVLEGGVLF